VYGLATAASGTNYGVYGETASPTGFAGYFQGPLRVNGSISTSNTALETFVNGARAIRLEAPPFAVFGANIIAGYSSNAVTPGVGGAVIGGGGGFIGNSVTDDWGTIGGGAQNRAGDGAGTTDDRPGATVGGGFDNRAISNITTVGGGSGNTASGQGATVGGGLTNVASGFGSTVPGGESNQAGGAHSLAAGRMAKVRSAAESADIDGDEGTFVWADSSININFQSTGPHQFLIRAAGGVGINTNSPSPGGLSVNGETTLNSVLKLVPAASAPSCFSPADAGKIYYSSSHALCVCVGSPPAWVLLAGGGSCF
jgi:hypothetical protein